MSDLVSTTEHDGFRIKVFHGEQGYVAWTERVDGGMIAVGFTIAPKVGTRPYDDADTALKTALLGIDTKEVRKN